MDEIIEYYRARSGKRLVFRSTEIESIEPTPMGANLKTITGMTYKLAHHRAESTTRYTRPLIFGEHHFVYTPPRG